MVDTISRSRLASQHIASAPYRHPSEPHGRIPATIVLADDDHNIVDLLSDLLREEGYQVLCAANGHQAWWLCQEHDPNLVISDVMMPGMGGLELVSRLQHGSCQRPPRVILMSAVKPAVPVSGAAFLPKPFDLDEMLDSIATNLEIAADA